MQHTKHYDTCCKHDAREAQTTPVTSCSSAGTEVCCTLSYRCLRSVGAKLYQSC